MFKSLRSVLFVSLLGMIAASFLFFSLIAVPSIRGLAVSQIRNQLLIEARMSEGIFLEMMDRGSSPQSLQKEAVRLSKASGSRVTVIDKSGLVLADSDEPQSSVPSMDNHLQRPEVEVSRTAPYGSSIRYSQTTKRDQVYLAVAVRDSAGGIKGYLRLSDPSEYIPAMMFKFYRSLSVAFVFAALICAVLSYFISILFTKPIERLVRTSKKISEGDLPQTIMKRSWFEFGYLERSIEEMSGKLYEMFNNIIRQKGSSDAVFEGIRDGVLVIGHDGKIMAANSTAEKIFDREKGEMAGRPVIEAVRNNEIAEQIERSLREEKESEEEISIAVPVEGTFYVYTGPVKDETGKVFGSICVLHDITRLKQLEKFRSEFVANVSHELKTPLTAIKNYTETLLNGAVDDKDKRGDFLLKIEKHSGSLASLIDDILEISDLETKKKITEEKHVNISQAVSRAVEAVEEKAKQKKIIIDVECDRNISIRSTKDHIYRAISNLIDNAVNYTGENGRIKIKCCRDDNEIMISVSDTGIGIPKESLERIFERFYRVDAARSRQTGGTGLGLSIVKHIMELHCGSVKVESQIGKSSVFTLTFPIK